MTTKRRKNARRSTAMVFNPAGRALSLAGGGRINPARKRRRHHKRGRRRNPIAARSTSFKRNPRRVRNPASVGGLVVASLMAGLGVTVFDILSTKFLPQSSVVRIATKAGGAYLLQSGWGRKIPVLGKYSQEIALVLGVSAAIDAFKLWLLPALAPTLNSVGLLPAGYAASAGSDQTTGNIFGNAFSPEYQPYA